MIDLILRDSKLYPKVFVWWGPLPVTSIADWERAQSLCAPEDLKRLWALKGGADLFDDSETLLQPLGAQEFDLVGPVSEVFWKRGLSTDCYVFHTGRIDCVFRKLDGALYALTSQNDLTQMSQLKDLDEWYSRIVRPTYEEGYGLRAL